MNNRIEIGLNKELILKFKCVEDTDNDGCNSCAFNGADICTKLNCIKSERSDYTNVHFELINE